MLYLLLLLGTFQKANSHDCALKGIMLAKNDDALNSMFDVRETSAPKIDKEEYTE
jgi:hypothetical protein